MLLEATATPTQTVVREISADLETPIGAFLRLDDGVTPAYLLESVEGGERLGRYSFLAGATEKAAVAYREAVRLVPPEPSSRERAVVLAGLAQYLMGGHNAEAARYSGVGTKTVVAWAYALSGVLAAVSAVIIAFYTNSISPASHGNFYELYAIAAAVVGGCSLRGGEGTVLGIVIGAALLQVLRNLVNLLDIPGSLDFAVMGAVILFGAVADQLFGRRMRRGGA